MKLIAEAGVLIYSFIVKLDGGSVLNLYAFNGAGNRSTQRGLKTIFLWGNSANRYATTLHSLQPRESA